MLGNLVDKKLINTKGLDNYNRSNYLSHIAGESMPE